MTVQKAEDTRWQELRRRAERMMGRRPTGTDQEEDPQIQQLLQEIMLSQSELELQNEALLQNERAVQAAKEKYYHLYRRYAQLFDFAPHGAMVINANHVIREMNLTAAIMLKGVRKALIGRRLTDFIHRDDQDGFYLHMQHCRKRPESIVLELRMVRSDGTYFDAWMQMQCISGSADAEPQFNLAVEDIRDRATASSSLALYEQVLDVAGQMTDKQHLLDEYVRLIKFYAACDAVGIRIRDDQGNIPYQAYVGFSRQFYEAESPLSLHDDQCMCITVIKGNPDPASDYFTEKGSFYINGTSRFLSTLSTEGRGVTRNACNAHGYESVALIPIPINATICGLIHVADRRENKFPIRVVESLENTAARIGLALERFSMQDRLLISLQTQNELSSHLLTVQEGEQRRIAMELHDGCGQDLNVLKLRLKRLQNRLPPKAVDLVRECDGLMHFSDKIINDIRDIAHGLKPAALDALGLTIAVRQMVREFSVYAKVQVETTIDLLSQIENPMAKTCLFRIFQEALSNIHKHARATWVLMFVSRQGDTLLIRIEDNGIGFDARPKEAGRDHGQHGMGLSTMALRCRMIGADLTIDSQVGQGTRLLISLPCPNPKALR